MRIVLLLITCVTLGACQSTGDIAYSPTVPLIAGPPAISRVTTKDIRDEKPNRLATVRGLYGNPAKVFDTNRSVADEVSAAFSAALQARGMLAPTAPNRMQLTLRTFYGDTYFARRAFIDLDLAVVDQAGNAVYRDSFKRDIAGYDVFSGITDLVPFTEKMLDVAIDTLLDKPEFRSALSRPKMAATLPASWCGSTRACP